MGEVILKIENGTKKFKNELIFQNVSMEFEKGNSYGFVGPNGAGKTTTIRIITAVEKVSFLRLYADTPF